MKKISIIFVSMCFLFIADGLAQSISWQKIYRNPLSNDAVGNDICEADGSNFYIAGTSAPSNQYIYVLKINQFGDTIWSKILGSGEAFGVTPSGDGGCVLVGGRSGIYAMRLNLNGDTLWKKFYNGRGGYDIKKTSDGGYIICGDKPEGFFNKGYICKIDSLGNLQWERIYFTGTRQLLRQIWQVNGSNGYLACGEKDSTNGLIRGCLLRIDLNGNVLWERTYVIGINGTLAESIVQKNNGFVLGGTAYIYPSSDSARAFMLKTDLNGFPLLSRIFPSSYSEFIIRIVIENNNKYYLSHWTGSPTPSLYGNKISSLDSNFNIIKKITLYPDSNSLSLYSLLNISNSTDIIGCGSNDQRSFANLDVYAVRLDSALNPPPPISIQKISNAIPQNFKLHQNYPNPFNPLTNIKFDILRKSNVAITVYDILGREIETVCNDVYGPGSYNIVFKAKNLSSGIYIYSLVIDGILIETKKMLLIK